MYGSPLKKKREKKIVYEQGDKTLNKECLTYIVAICTQTQK